MPFIVPVSVKIAITLGAVVGAGVAVLHNKEMLFELMERKLSQGAAYCGERARHYQSEKMAAGVPMYSDNTDDDEPVTPEDTDIESDMVEELD